MRREKKDYIRRLLVKNGLSPDTILHGYDRCKGCVISCCEKNACAMLSCDFEKITVKTIKKMVKSGEYMIAANIVLHSGRDFPMEPVLYVCPREEAAGPVHLSLLHSKCSKLGEQGCLYDPEKRPTQGLMVIPGKGNEPCIQLVPSLSKEWAPYQGVLKAVVREITKLDADDLFKSNVFKELGKLRMKLQKHIYQEQPWTINEKIALSMLNQAGLLNVYEELIYNMVLGVQ